MKIEGLKILVTGGAGFIGSHIVDELVRRGAGVIVYDNFSSGSIENLKDSKEDIKIVEGDILDYAKLAECCKGVDIISHQAAQLEITTCIDDPTKDLRINTEGSLNVFNAAVKTGAKKVLYASSACVYGQAQYVPQDENHPTQPNWPYGVSKLAAEKYANIYAKYYDVSMVGLRYAITYGPREWYGRVLPVFLKRALENKPPVVWDGGQIRDFTCVVDAVTLHNLCIENDGVKNEIFNVSTGVGTSILDLANIVIDVLGLNLKPLYEIVAEGEMSDLVEGRKRLPLELKRMVLDNKKAKGYFGWEPKVTLRDGLIREMEWFVANRHRWGKMSY